MFVELVAFMLIQRLGHDDFRTREAATKELRRLEPIAQLQAVRSEDPEVTHRVRGLLADYRATFRPTKYPVTPWLCRLPKDYPAYSEVYEYYQPTFCTQWSRWPWVEWRFATDRLVDDLIARGDSRESIVRLLDRMAEREKEYIRSCGPGHPLEPLLDDKLPADLVWTYEEEP